MKGKIIAIVVSLTCAALIAPSVAQGITAAELQAQIDALLAQLTDLQTQLATLQGETPTPTVSGCKVSSFDQNLKQGMSGDDVNCLQIVLNSSADTQLASSGVGSPGQETSYFGPLTKAAVIKFQEKYASEVLASWGLTAGTGFVGSTTRTKLNSLLVVTPPITPPAGCECTSWANVACAGGTCSATQMQQTRTCTPSACALETQCVADATCGAVPTGAGLTVSLASDTYAASTLVDGQSLAPLAKFKFYNGDDAEIKITTIKLKRIGVSADTTLTNVYLFEGAIRLTDNASVSESVITFTDSTGIIKIASGSSKTISVESDIAADISGQTVGVAINAASDISTNASSVNGSFPLSGNYMTIADATLAGVNFNATTNPQDASIDPQNDYRVWENTVSITTRKVKMTRISLREIGTIKYADLINFRLSVDGVELATLENLDADGYITFDLTDNPKTLETGSRVIKVMADILGGSDRTFTFSLRKTADVTFIDSQYGAKVLVQAESTTFTARTTGTQEINSGVITITKMSDSPSGDVIETATNALLGKFEVKAAGENIKIETLRVSVDVGNNASTAIRLRNGIVKANGVQVGSTTGIYDINHSGTTDYTDYSLGSSLIVQPGSPVTLEIYADIYDDDGDEDLDSTDDTIMVRIEGGSLSNAQGQVSLATINAPAADVDGNTLTVKTGGLTLSKYGAYPDNTVIVPQTGFKVAWFTLTANTTEAVNLNTIDLDWAVSGATVAATHLSNLYIKYGTQVTSTKASVTNSNNAWSINYELGKGKIIDVEIYANIDSAAYDGTGDADKIQAQLALTGTTKDSAAQVYGNSTGASGGSNINGQLFTFQAGQFSASETEDPIDKIAAANQTITAANFKFTSLYDSFTLKELKFKVPDDKAGAVVSEIVVKDGTTELARGALNADLVGGIPTSRNFTGLSVSIPASTTKKLTVDLKLGDASADLTPRTSNVNTKVTLDSYKKATSQGVETTTTTTCTSADCAGNNIYTYKTIPTITQVAVASSAKPTGNGSEGELYKFKIAASEKGDVAVKQLKFTVSWSDAEASDTLEIESIKVMKGNQQITSGLTIQDEDGSDVSGTTGLAGGNLTDSANTDLVLTWTTEEEIPAGTEYTYTIKGTPKTFSANNTIAVKDSFSIYMPTDSSADTTRFYLNSADETTIIRLDTAPADTATSTATANIIWSDESAITHSVYPGTVGASSTADWSNGNLVLNTPLSSEGLSL